MQTAVDRPERMALRCLEACRVTELPVRPAELIRRCRNTRLMTFSEAAEMLGMEDEAFERQMGGADAVTFREDDACGNTRFIVCCREGGNPARKNFTLAHELGHIVLDHSGRAEQEEIEADRFATWLLCPPAVCDALAERGELYAERVAEVCYISLSAALHLNAKERAQREWKMETETERLLRESVKKHVFYSSPKADWHRIMR